ncbi:hypothetical protein G5B39_03165 [Rhodobacteraceae bacterium SC52]|nr:hypothetical protein G5B39_03165 [Rhodobacteraceae bacterium SC52]
MPRDGALIVAAQWDRQFMREAALWRDGPCRATYFDGADSTRDDLFAALKPGASLVYLGHSTPRAWLGFRGIRADHIPKDVPPLARVIALTCHGAAADGLGAAWLDAGARSVTGPQGSIEIDALLKISAILRAGFASPNCLDPMACLGGLSGFRTLSQQPA